MKTSITAVVATLSACCILLAGFRRAAPAPADGKPLFIANCGPCHAPNKSVVGPPFQHIRKDYPAAWIFAMVRNHDSVCSAPTPRSVYLAAVWQNTRTNTTFQFTDEQITAILDYVDAQPLAKQYYSHRKMPDHELNSIAQFLNAVPIDTALEVYMGVFDSVRGL